MATTNLSVDPKSIFLHAVSDPSAADPAIVDLVAAGFAPNDILQLVYEVPPPGFSYFGCDGPFVGAEETPVLAVFSGSNPLLPASALARVPDAIDA